MPLYEFHCRGCHADFEHFLSLAARDSKPPCPKCPPSGKSAGTFRLVSRIIAHTPTAYAHTSEQERAPAIDETGACKLCADTPTG